MNEYVNKWTTSTKHVDMTTGEFVEKNQLRNYKKVKTTKYVSINNTTRKGHTEYTIFWAPKQQTEINFPE